MHFRKSIFALTLFGCLLLSSTALGGTWGDFEYIEYSDFIYIRKYIGAGGDVLIPANIAGKPITHIGTEAFYQCTSVTSVVIPDSVTSIGGAAFSGCTGLTSVTIPGNIGSYAFYQCTGLTSVTIMDGVTSIGEAAFCQCPGLTILIIPGSVISIGDWAFYQCTGLTSVTIHGNIGTEAFYQCTSVTSVTIVDGVTSIGWRAFYGCFGLTSVTIPGSVTSIGDMAFYGSYSLTAAYFCGNAPVVSFGMFVFDACAYNFKIYYQEGADGFTSPTWNGYLTVVDTTNVCQTGVTTTTVSVTTTTTIPGGTTTTTISNGTTTTIPGGTTTTTICSGPCCVNAIYGESSEQTQLLRKYRDNVLSKTPEGQEIIKVYCAFSPKIVSLLEKNPLLKNKAKMIIDSMLPGIRKKVEETNKDQ